MSDKLVRLEDVERIVRACEPGVTAGSIIAALHRLARASPSGAGAPDLDKLRAEHPFTVAPNETALDAIASGRITLAFNGTDSRWKAIVALSAAARAELAELRAKAALADDMANEVLRYQADDVNLFEFADWLARYRAITGKEPGA